MYNHHQLKNIKNFNNFSFLTKYAEHWNNNLKLTIMRMLSLRLKVPKRENFSLAFFALSEPIWVCELGTDEKNRIFYRLTPEFDGFWFFAAY
jgi:hypothetical protein